MAIHNEIEFENDICDYLAGNGWLYAEKHLTVTGKIDARGYKPEESVA